VTTLFIARALVVALVFVQGARPSVDITGVWNGTLELESVSGHPTLTFKQEGEKVTGTYEGRYGASPLEGTLKDKALHFVITINAEGIQTSGTFDGSVDGDKMSGRVRFDSGGEGTWYATRAAAKK